MSDRRRFIARLGAADRSFCEERLRPEGVRRIANEMSRVLDAHSARRQVRWVPMATFVAGAALVLAFLAWGDQARNATLDAPRLAQHVASQAVVSGANCRHEVGEPDQVWGTCVVVMREPGVRIQTIDAAHLTLEPRVVRVHQGGSAVFDVDKVVGDPVRVIVPGGEIRVVGTRFRVAVHGSAGQVDLYEGRLEFWSDDGSRTPIRAGETLEFGERGTQATQAAPTTVAEPATLGPRLADPPIPALESDDPPRPRTQKRAARTAVRRAGRSPRSASTKAEPETDRDAGALIEDVQRMRRLGQYERAVSRLQDALKYKWPPRTAEVLSNELGRILSRRVNDPVRACAHWREHLGRFPTTRYRSQIEASLAKLDCS